MSWRDENQLSHSGAPEPAEPVPELGQRLRPAVCGGLDSRLGHDLGNAKFFGGGK